MMATAPINISVARNFDDFMAMAPGWAVLHARAERPLPFLRHGWLRLSWQLRRRRLFDRLCVIIVKEGGEPVMAGAFIFTWRRPLPEVNFLGSGMPQYGDALWVRSDRTAEHAEALLTALAEEHGAPRWLRAREWPVDSPLRIAASRRPGALGSERPISRIDLAGLAGWDAYFGQLSRQLRSDHRRQLRRLGEAGSFSFAVEVGQPQRQALHWLMSTKLDWAERTSRDVRWLRDGSGERFFSALLEAPDGPQCLVTTLRSDGRIIAAALGLRDGPTLYLSKIAHDPSFATLSPGRTLVMFLIELAFAEGITLVDLMAGTTGWKRRFATGRTSIVSQKVRLR